jgi:hypothetical protein
MNVLHFVISWSILLAVPSCNELESSLQDPAFRNFSRLLLKAPEHTWGVDTKQAPASFNIWKNDEFRAALGNNTLFATAEKSWDKQFAYIPWSVQVRCQNVPLYLLVPCVQTTVTEASLACAAPCKV